MVSKATVNKSAEPSSANNRPRIELGVKEVAFIGVAALTFSIWGAHVLENLGRNQTSAVAANEDVVLGLTPSSLTFPMPRRLAPPDRAVNCTKEVFLSESEQAELFATGSTTELTQAASSFKTNDALARIGIISSTDTVPTMQLAQVVSASVVEAAYPAVAAGDQLMFVGVSDTVHSPEVRIDLQSGSCFAAKTALARWDQPRFV